MEWVNASRLNHTCWAGEGVWAILEHTGTKEDPDATCAFWDKSAAQWSSEGVQTLSSKVQIAGQWASLGPDFVGRSGHFEHVFTILHGKTIWCPILSILLYPSFCIYGAQIIRSVLEVITRASIFDRERVGHAGYYVGNGYMNRISGYASSKSTHPKLRGLGPRYDRPPHGPWIAVIHCTAPAI